MPNNGIPNRRKPTKHGNVPVNPPLADSQPQQPAQSELPVETKVEEQATPPVETKVEDQPVINTVQPQDSTADPLTAGAEIIAPSPALKPGETIVPDTGEIVPPVRPDFKLAKGNGWIFYSVGRDDTFVFAGHMRFTEANEQGKRIEGRLVAGKGWEFTVMEFGDKSWKRYGSFTMPALGDQRYVEQWVDIPIEALDVAPTEQHKTFRAKLRMWKGKERYDGGPSLRMVLPDLAKDSPSAIKSKIPM